MSNTTAVKNNQLVIGGFRVNELVEQFNTPLYVYDVALMDEKINQFKESFKSDKFETSIVYASKAFLTVGMAKYVSEQGLSIDAVSLGELYTIYQSGFDMNKVVFHGNNKSNDELTFAVKSGVGYIVVDNVDELKELIEVCNQLQRKQKTLLRVNPGIEAHTHEYIQTSKLDSKFGVSIFDENMISEIISYYQTSEYLVLSGFHCHIGSQIIGMEAFVKTAQVMIDFSKQVMPTGVDVLNLGGGFGVNYTNEKPNSIQSRMTEYIDSINKHLDDTKYPVGQVMIEPGRSIVANAGTTLYTVGSTKTTYSDINYLFIDGGMTDNIRPALYQAKYHVDVANRLDEEMVKKYHIAGKCCETGDILIKDAMLPNVSKGDVVAIYSTGAYGYSMASNYNRLQKPAVVFVKDRKAQVIVERESLEDLINNDIR